MTSIQKVALILLAAIGTAHAQSSYPPNPAYADNSIGTIQPYRGVYFDGKTPGTAIRVDVAASGAGVVELYQFDASGQPHTYTTTGTYQPADEVTRWTTGVIGTMTTVPILARSGVRCPGCPPTVTPSPLNIPGAATLTWVNSREVKMVAAGNAWDLTAPNLDTGTDADYLAGTWATTFVLTLANPGPSDQVHHHQAYSAPLLMIPSPTPVVVAAGSSQMSSYTPSIKVYTASCGWVDPADFGRPHVPGADTICASLNMFFAYTTQQSTTALVNFVFWYDKSTNKFALDLCVLQQVHGVQTCVIGPKGFHVDLYLDGPNSLVGRGMNQGIQSSGNLYVSGQLGIAVKMTRLPSVATTE
jgi:hypothetical protein